MRVADLRVGDIFRIVESVPDSDNYEFLVENRDRDGRVLLSWIDRDGTRHVTWWKGFHELALIEDEDEIPL